MAVTWGVKGSERPNVLQPREETPNVLQPREGRLSGAKASPLLMPMKEDARMQDCLATRCTV